jgi:hypothetical protein
MKRNVLFFVLFIGFVFSVFGQNISDFRYIELNGGIIITGYRGSVRDVVIPERINGLPVIAIGVEAFSPHQETSKVQLTSVILPNSIFYIGELAFEDNQLTSVVAPNSFVNLDVAFDSNVRIIRR